MAHYKHIDTSPRFLVVDLQRQLLPGTFEHAMNHLINHELDLAGFDARFCNDKRVARGPILIARQANLKRHQKPCLDGIVKKTSAP